MIVYDVVSREPRAGKPPLANAAREPRGGEAPAGNIRHRLVRIYSSLPEQYSKCQRQFMCQRHNSCTVGAIHASLLAIHAREPRWATSDIVKYEFVPHAPKQAVRTANQFPLLFSTSCFYSLRSSFLYSELRIPNSALFLFIPLPYIPPR